MRDKSCGKKIRHTSKDHAIIHAKSLSENGFNVYHCKRCNHWHIGRSRSQVRSADRIADVLEKHAKKLHDRMAKGILIDGT